MVNNLLDGWLKLSVGEAGFYAVLGYAFVFFGILLLIIVLTLLGKIIDKINGIKKEGIGVEEVQTTQPAVQTDMEKVDPQVVAVITAALMAYYQTEQPKCDFVVKRIRKI